MEKIREILTAVNRVIVGKEDKLAYLLAGILCGGHLLVEDVPGTGKTTLAKTLAVVLGCSFKRIQFTPDLMPSDIIGLSIYDRERSEFVYQPGPVMSQFVLADEINRTSPKTQAALLEAMAEKQVTVDGISYPLPEPFIVMATQNPIEYEGTYPLPEAQLDRFMMQITLGYPDYEYEKQIVKLDPARSLPEELDKVIDAAGLVEMQRQLDCVYLAAVLEDYIVGLTRASRIHPDLLLGVSPRGGQYLYRASRALAAVKGRDFVLPDDIKELLPPVFSHRLIVRPEARLKGKTGEDILEEILHQTHVPVFIDDRDQ
jgi:MoxR-like ATPase